ncbi:HipA family kinase [Aliarcobacter cryaerophilus]|uniref:HipA family kinase n=1 Tax=Aliarcobacter cryaerophilus TaxID=28198 RepID=UPI003BB17ADF
MRELKLLRIKSIIKSAGFGGSKPIIVTADNDKTYVLKTREDGTNPKDLGIFNELLGYQLHDFLGFNISPQDICYFYIDDDFLEMANNAFQERIIEQESYLYIKDSKGVNLGIEYIENAMEIIDYESLSNVFKKSTMQLDNYIMNYDRVKDHNPNILQDKYDKRKFYAIDYGNALADGILYQRIQETELDIFEAGKYSSCNALLSSKRYMFRDEKSLMRHKQIKDDLATITDFLNAIIDEMPRNWEILVYRVQLVDVIALRLLEKKIFATNEDLVKCESLY